MARLEYLELDVLNSNFQQCPFDVFGNQLSQIFNHHLVISEHSFFQNCHQWIFDNNRIFFILIRSRSIKVVKEILIISENIINLAFYDLIYEYRALLSWSLDQSCHSILEMFSVDWKLFTSLTKYFIH